MRETEPVTLPPAAMISSVACSRVRLGNVPVRTKVFSASGPSPGGGPSSSKRRPSPAQIGDELPHLRIGQLLVDQVRHLRADARGRLDLLGSRFKQRIDRAELIRQVSSGDLADLFDAQRVQHPPERLAFGFLDRRARACAPRPRQNRCAARSGSGPGGRSPPAVFTHPELHEQADLLFAETVDVHRADEVLEQLPPTAGTARGSGIL